MLRCAVSMLLDFLALALSVVAATTIVYSILLIIRVRTSINRVPTARAGAALPVPADGWPSVCIVVPAHNEERVIGAMAESLAAQDYPRLRVVFALDRCTDGAEAALKDAIGADRRFEIIHITSCPDDWAGKTHAVWRGVNESEGAADAELLLFADADTVFDPICVRATVALLLDRGLDMLSLLSTLTSRRWWELVGQPAAAFELLRHFPIHRVNIASKSRPAFANGQFMLFRADAYRRIGGHESVKSELLEDMAFARALRDGGMRNGLLLADGVLHCRMYGSWDAFQRGWKRIFIESARRRPARLRAWARRLIVTDVLLPISALMCLLLGVIELRADDQGSGWIGALLGTAALAAWLISIGVIHRVQRSPMWTPILHPVGAWLTAKILRDAAGDLETGKGVTWAGRTYAREKR